MSLREGVVVKMMGLVAIFFFCMLLGIFVGERKKRAVRECEAFLELFMYVKGQIGYFYTPTKLIWREARSRYLESIGFMDALLKMEEDDVYYDAFSRVFAMCEDGFSMSEEARALIRAFGEKIGKSGGDEQLTSIEYYISELRGVMEKERVAAKKDARLYMTLGAALGLAVFIMLI